MSSYVFAKHAIREIWTLSEGRLPANDLIVLEL